METTTFIPVTKQAEAWICNKIRREFDSLTNPWDKDKAKELIHMASSMGFDELAREMEEDL